MYVDTRSHNLEGVASDLTDIHNVMTKSLREVLDRSGSINESMEKSESLMIGSQKYKNLSKQLNRDAFWKTYSFFFLLLLLIALFLYFYYFYF